MHLADVTDEDLLRATLDGGETRERAFLELVDRYEHRIYAICHRFFGNHADAQDATQDTFLAIARRAGSFRGDSLLSTWIFRVAVNACKDLARARARRPQMLVEDVQAAADASGTELSGGDDGYGLVEVADDIAAALAQLDETSRTLIILCAIEGRDYAEVAGVMDMPVGTVKSRVFRARAKLAKILAPLVDPSSDEPTDRPRGSHTPSAADPSGGISPRGPPAE
ncbi:MAG: RNA polymerase sigma-70 factor (ECF subfamily) [Glaciecola sp.]|jgi:RNA polymerase sigma-70 factor (ECF subfamily)